MDVVEKVKEVIAKLDEIDNYADSLTDKLSNYDSKEQDLLHYIEENKINVLWCYRFLKEIKSIRQERRKIKNDMELLYKYNEQKTKLASKDYRQFLLSEMCKREKSLNQPYKNRIYTEEEIQKVLKGA